LAKIDPQKRRQVIVVTIILCVALLGFVMITMQQSGEKHGLFAQSLEYGPQPQSDSLATVPSTAYTGAVGKAVATVSIFKMVLALAVVIVCIYVGIFLMKKMTTRRATGKSGTSLLEVLETAHLDPKKSLSLVRVADRSVLIGVTDGQISVLTELDQERTSSVIASMAQKTQTDSFGTLFRSASERLKGLGLTKDSTN
jgi:flagellar biosynthetic protein FliO